MKIMVVKIATWLREVLILLAVKVLTFSVVRVFAYLVVRALVFLERVPLTLCLRLWCQLLKRLGKI